MREYGQIQCSFWTHPKIRALSDESTLLATYLLTGPHSNGLGCYRLPFGYVMADLRWDEKTVSKAFRNLIDSLFCLRCEDTEWVLIPDFLEWNSISNPKVASARVKEARECPKGSSVWPAMVEAIERYATKHMPDDFLQLLTKEWKPIVRIIPNKNRELVMERDKGVCQECGSQEDITIEHIRPIIYGGTHAVENLRVLC